MRIPKDLGQGTSYDRDAVLDELRESLELVETTELEDKKLRALLRPLVHDKSWSIRWKVIEMLGLHGNRLDRRQIELAARDREWIVRACAYEALACLGFQCSKGVIAQGLKDRNAVVRSFAALALYDLVGAQAESAVRARFKKEQHRRGQIGLSWALALCGDEEALSVLRVLSQHPWPGVYEIARRALDDVAQSEDSGNP